MKNKYAKVESGPYIFGESKHNFSIFYAMKNRIIIEFHEQWFCSTALLTLKHTYQLMTCASSIK